RRRLRSLTSLVFLFSIAAVDGASAQSAVVGLERLEAFLDEVRSLTASFKQELWTEDEQLLQTDTGTLSLKRPNRFRWTYDAPAELVIVADGAKLWIYDKELAEVTVTPFDDSVGASPAVLLSGDRNVREDFDVVRSYTLDELDWIELEPKTASDFSSISIGFSGNEPRRLELVDGLGQVTRVVLDDLAVNPEIADDVFHLDVPSGVDVNGEG
ncbi:MAG TPA: outer membrane lipoprotein chaperone LolA, partial [Gammaproteobacteria bacterium]|nr:outer membrane lipoprotein chaperone LolA [Gammaproteobacteria bacterium]